MLLAGVERTLSDPMDRLQGGKPGTPAQEIPTEPYKIQDQCVLSASKTTSKLIQRQGDEAAQSLIEKNGESDKKNDIFSVESSEISLLEQCLERLEKKKEELEKKPDNEMQKWIVVKKLRYSPGKHMMRLARLSQTTDVRKFISGVNANINMVKGDRGVDKKEIKMAVVQMQQVIQRARVKIKNLDEEALSRSIGKSAAKQKEMERARAIEQELKRRITARRAREYAEAKASFQPMDLVGSGKTPEERWEETFTMTPQELAASASAPLLPAMTDNPSPAQVAAVAQTAALSTGGDLPAGIDVYV